MEGLSEFPLQYGFYWRPQPAFYALSELKGRTTVAEGILSFAENNQEGKIVAVTGYLWLHQGVVGE